jgi:5'-nucleotidase
MNVLLSNDDGIGSVGLQILEDAVRNLSKYKVTVVAPDSNMSASGHSLTLSNPLRLTKYDSNHFSVNGTPVDCIIMGLEHIVDQRPDFVLSGINCDANLADDVLYSGTVAAAAEASVRGIPSIALSQNIRCGEEINWNVPRKYASLVLDAIMGKFEFPNRVFLNVNFPACDVDDVRGIKVTTYGTRPVYGGVVQSTDPRGKPYFWIGAAEYRRAEDHKDIEADLWAVYNGYVSITPMSLNMTDMKSISNLERLF